MGISCFRGDDKDDDDKSIVSSVSLGLSLNLFLFLALSSNCCRQNFKHDSAETSSSHYNTCYNNFSHLSAIFLLNGML